MADYYSILNKTITNLGSNTPEVRQAVYNKAKSAIEKQLRSMNPTPAEQAIQAQLKLLDDSITLIEAENSAGEAAAVAATQPAAPEPVPEPAPVAPQPESVQVAPPTQPATVVQDAPATLTVEQQPVASPGLPAEPAVAAPAEPVVATMPVEPAIAPQMTDNPLPPQAEIQAAPAAVTPVAPQPEVQPAPVAPSSAPVAPQPTVQPAPTQPAAPVAPAPVAAQPAVASGVVSPEPVAAPQQASGAMIDTNEPAKKGGILGKLLIWLIVLALLIGGAFVAWVNRDSLKNNVEDMLFGAADSGSSTDVSEQSNKKEPVRIGQDGEDAAVTPVEGTSDTEGTTEIAVTETNTQEPVEELVTETPTAQEQETEQPTAAQSEPEQETANTETVVPVGEVAYLYEEGTGGSGATRSAGAVAWELVRESPGDSLPPESVVIGNIQLAEKDIAAKMIIKRNIDESLSASHLIELSFTLGSNFEGGSIENVARFVMKATEEARGEPLVAVPVKVSDGNFLIALNNLQQAVDVNNLLMRDGGWIDIPITYKNGKRALVTLEKGGTGERVFIEALDDWKNR